MINKATLIGRIGNKSEKTLKNGQCMLILHIATDSKWTTKEGQAAEKTTWHAVNFFSRLAEVAKEYAHVGNLVYIEGAINHEKMTTGDHIGQWSYSITASHMKFLPSGSKKTDGQKAEKEKSSHKNKQSEDGFNDDEVPF